MSASDRDPLVGERLNYFESYSFDGGTIFCSGSASVLAGLQTAVLPQCWVTARQLVPTISHCSVASAPNPTYDIKVLGGQPMVSRGRQIPPTAQLILDQPIL